MQTVLGFATTQTTVELVRIDGFGTDDASVTRDSLQAQAGGGDLSSDAYAQLAALVWFRMRRLGRTQDHGIRSVGVTWGDGAAHEATLLVEALTAAGLDHVVAVDPTQAVDESALGEFDTSGDQSALAMGAAVAASRGDATQATDVADRPRVRRRRPDARRAVGLLAGGVALFTLLSVGSGLRPTPEQPVRSTPAPQEGTGTAIVPIRSEQAPRRPARPPVAPPVLDSESNGDAPSEPPAAVVPELPASVPIPAPAAPEPPLPAAPPPAPNPAPSEQSSPNANCVLLCGIAI